MQKDFEKSHRTQIVRLGCIGLGMIGRVHAEVAKQLDECDLLAVCDPNESTKRIADNLDVTFYADYREMIEKEELDGVIIAVPNELHASVGSTCAANGLHMLIEKPIASSIGDADILIYTARENNVSLLVGHHRRFNPSVEATRQMIRGGQIGRLVGLSILWATCKPTDYFQGPFSWRRSKGGGIVLINLIHEIDNIRYICGEITRVHAEISNKVRKFPVEDSASVSLRLENGALGSIFISDCTPSFWSYEATTGENPFFFHSSENCYHFFGTEASLEFPNLRKVYYPNKAKSGWQYPILTEEIRAGPADSYREQLRHFCNVIRGEEIPRTSGEDAKKTLEVTLAALESGETGQPIPIKNE